MRYVVAFSHLRDRLQQVETPDADRGSGSSQALRRLRRGFRSAAAQVEVRAMRILTTAGACVGVAAASVSTAALTWARVRYVLCTTDAVSSRACARVRPFLERRNSGVMSGASL